MTTPRQLNGYVPATPGLLIGVATPALPQGCHTLPTASALAPTAEEEVNLELDPSQRSSNNIPDEKSNDYFSANSNADRSEASSESNLKAPAMLSEGQQGQPVPPATSADDKEEKKKGLFGKNFKMAFPKNMKIGRASTDAKSSTATEEKPEEVSDKSSETDDKVFEDNFFGIIQRIRRDYDEHVRTDPGQLLVGITPSLPNETPVIKPPAETMVIIQEDNPESGGVADLYRGAISTLGKDADVLEKVAPTWLGELLLKVKTKF